MKNFLFYILAFTSLILNAQKLTDNELTGKQLEFLEVLNILRPKIDYNNKGIEGFYEFYKGKKKVEIPGHRITDKYIEDISLLATLPDMEYLRLKGCITPDFSVLKKAKKLREFEIIEHQTQLSLSSIFEITQLENLMIENCEYFKGDNLKGIKKLTKLKRLKLYNLPIVDISAISKLKMIEVVDLTDLKIENTGKWDSLNLLKELTLFDCNIETLDFLSHISSLEVLSAKDNYLKSFNLKNTKNLYYLNLNRNNITNIDNIGGAINLTGLELTSNNLSDITSLKNLKNLTLLNINHNHITDVCSLTSNKKLERVNITDNPIGDISCLKDLPNLKNLEARKTCFCNPEDLEELKNGVSCNALERFLIAIYHFILSLFN